jgi:hypothetical protein
MVCVSPREGCEARDELRDEKGLEQGLVAAAKEEAGDPHLVTIPPAFTRLAAQGVPRT